ncbi:galactose-6-phosphate isomerase subunit LacA [Staphylococcus sp. SQ8-PEA]|uniref:Galactose-6-phosphate isomerase subunit LacA n=1 Tax=Staphylococcus marylandisciuri TaxID=2981529 RepID=A0ABT2QMB8_9STAP|nr:galactose-6-phosphate isomerase subunit LacA [Staphylococcus marylandisciuri]MCU5745124.1 galactose-6-phosphate isomerase subunit LacA [Staphylococcus marylandisciuri]
MKVFIGSDREGLKLKSTIRDFLVNDGYDVCDVTENEQLDFVDSTLKLAKRLKDDSNALGIMIDAYGAGSFMVATKVKGLISAEVSDERSAYMTRAHNNAQLITIGANLVGEVLAIEIVKAFLNGSYDGGRHQIRVDMLNKMC